MVPAAASAAYHLIRFRTARTKRHRNPPRVYTIISATREGRARDGAGGNSVVVAKKVGEMG